MLNGLAKTIKSELQALQQQGYFDKVKLKILENLQVTIEDVHIRGEQEKEIKPTEESKDHDLPPSF